jgi:hypothetical protein
MANNKDADWKKKTYIVSPNTPSALTSAEKARLTVLLAKPAPTPLEEQVAQTLTQLHSVTGSGMEHEARKNYLLAEEYLSKGITNGYIPNL